MAEEQKRAVVTVMCGVTNGVSLRLCREFDADGIGGRKVLRPFGEPVILQGPKDAAGAAHRTTEPVPNAGVDKSFIEQWLEQNAGSHFVTDGLIRVVDDEAK